MSTYMRNEFEAVLKSYGHDVFLQRKSQDPTKEENELFSTVLERHTTRFSVFGTTGLENVAMQMPEGMVNSDSRVYYFKFDVYPFEGDRIYEHEPRAMNGQSVWEIDIAHPMYGVGGILAYWVTAATRLEPN